ncbi:hypothetical protein GVO57_07415 [Sphingomonas changnyeongensis]|uniref:Uncharacterized protein n=1 Tax=Sphingomonas changnyeongensis TaxID=2698679 RepID=A0A7Z2NWV3_9SPHN|nr:hypothetical protein [Sphingomonas changnyeongensis]QHL90694.1 hypothetical protein GVO57_07415 [Sphingomonas changnyeongensis]
MAELLNDARLVNDKREHCARAIGSDGAIDDAQDLECTDALKLTCLVGSHHAAAARGHKLSVDAERGDRLDDHRIGQHFHMNLGR